MAHLTRLLLELERGQQEWPDLMLLRLALELRVVSRTTVREQLWAGVYKSAMLIEGRGVIVTFDTMQTMKPFSSILYDSTVLSSWRILPAVRLCISHAGQLTPQTGAS